MFVVVFSVDIVIISACMCGCGVVVLLLYLFLVGSVFVGSVVSWMVIMLLVML